jgi:predicted GH43/DUF377 family glycosyl hydrolase
MHWKKRGKIFDPTGHALPHNCKAFAQAPQALVLLDRVRIYFSTREVEAATGKYLSHVAYVDMSKDFAHILQISQHTVIPLGKLGTFDEHGIFPMNVLRHGGLIYGFTSGVNRRASVPVDGAIGLAFSRDEGFTFQRAGDGPVLAPSLYEPCIVVDPFVLHVEGRFHMWYVFGLGWKPSQDTVSPSRVYKIGHAVSDDGVEWTKEEGRQILPDRLAGDECQALPTVAYIGDRYHMFFCYRQASDFRTNPSRSYRIGHASSTDLIHWSRDDSKLVLDPTPGGWDSDMMCYPHVFECEGRLHMLYNGNAFGREGFGLATLEV